MIVGITYSKDNLKNKARLIAEKRGFIFAGQIDTAIRFWLKLTKDNLTLVDSSGKLSPFKLDFLSGSGLYQLRHRTHQKDFLARAIGRHPVNTCLVDATAGLAADSIALLAYGFKIILIEQNQAVATLLEDALARASTDKEYGGLFKKNLSLITGSSQSIMNKMQKKPDIVYLDPMYPETAKSSLPLKPMQYLRSITKEGAEANSDLLAAALQNAQKKVVVKRPLKAAYLENIKPSHQINGKTTRYDVYIKN